MQILGGLHLRVYMSVLRVLQEIRVFLQFYRSAP